MRQWSDASCAHMGKAYLLKKNFITLGNWTINFPHKEASPLATYMCGLLCTNKLALFMHSYYYYFKDFFNLGNFFLLHLKKRVRTLFIRNGRSPTRWRRQRATSLCWGANIFYNNYPQLLVILFCKKKFRHTLLKILRCRFNKFYFIFHNFSYRKN